MSNESSFYNFDTNRWPIVILTIHGKPKDDLDFDTFLEKWKSIYVDSMTRGERYKLIFDTRLADMVRFDHLIKLGKWLKSIEDLTEKWMDRTAIIVANPSIKLLIQFVFKIYKAVRPFKIFGQNELPDAIKWLNDKDNGDLDKFDFSVQEDMDDQMKASLVKNQFNLR